MTSRDYSGVANFGCSKFGTGVPPKRPAFLIFYFGIFNFGKQIKSQKKCDFEYLTGPECFLSILKKTFFQHF